MSGKGTELRMLRLRIKVTQKEMAQLIGLHSNSLAKMERGVTEVSEPVIRLARVIAATKQKKKR